MDKIEEIKEIALRVKAETKEGGNTAERIGGLFEKIAGVLGQGNEGDTGTMEEFNEAFNKKSGEIFKNEKL